MTRNYSFHAIYIKFSIGVVDYNIEKLKIAQIGCPVGLLEVMMVIF